MIVCRLIFIRNGGQAVRVDDAWSAHCGGAGAERSGKVVVCTAHLCTGQLVRLAAHAVWVARPPQLHDAVGNPPCGGRIVGSCSSDVGAATVVAAIKGT